MNKEQLKKELLKYSKEEIIDAVVGISSKRWGCSVSSLLIDDILNELTFQSHQRVLDENLKLNDKRAEIFEKYINYQNELVKKYGKDGKCSLANVPTDELNELAKIQKEFSIIVKRTDASNKKLERFYNNGV